MIIIVLIYSIHRVVQPIHNIVYNSILVCLEFLITHNIVLIIIHCLSNINTYQIITKLYTYTLKTYIFF